MFSSKGLNVEALKRHQEKTGTLAGFAGAERELDASRATELFETPCDILIPAALEKQVGGGCVTCVSSSTQTCDCATH